MYAYNTRLKLQQHGLKAVSVLQTAVSPCYFLQAKF